MARTEPQVNLRMPDGLKERLQSASQTSNRSLTAEIVARLEQSFEWPTLSSGMQAAIEDQADLNGQSFADEVLARLNFTMDFDREFFDPKMEWVSPKGTLDERITGLESQLKDVVNLLHKLSGTVPEIDRPMDNDERPM